MGLPPQLAQEIVDAKLKGPISWLAHGLFMLIMIAGFVIGWLYLWPTLSNQVDANAYSAAQSMDGFAYETNFGLSLVIGMFVWIVSVALIISTFILRAPTRLKATLYLNAKSDFIGSTPKFYGLHKVIAEVGKFKTGSDYIDAICRKMISSLSKVVVPSLVLVLGLVWLETSWYKFYTPTHIVKNGLWSNALEKKKWRDISDVELGCNFIEARDSNPASNNIIYRVKWSDGSKASLDIDNQINGKIWLENFETVDTEIRSGNATFKRWVWLERNPLHPTCLNHFRTDLGPELTPRFNRLLRISELD